MKNLIKNEMFKMFKKRRVLVLFIFFTIIIFIISYMNYSESKNSNLEKTIRNSERYLEQLNKEKNRNDLTLEKKKKIESDIEVIERKIKSNKIELLEENIEWTEKLERDLKRLENEKIEAKNANNLLLEEQINGNIKLNKYYIENNIEPKKVTANKLIINSSSLINIFIIGFFVALLISDIVSGEFSSKTIKTLLVRPYSRSKILFSKFISSSIITTLTIVGAEFLTYLISGILIGFGDLNIPMLVGTKYVFDSIKYNTTGQGISAVANSSFIIPFWLYIIIALLIQILFIMACTSVCFLISTLCESNIASLMINIVIMITLTLFSIVSFSGHTIPIISKILPYTFIFYNDANQLISGILSKLSMVSYVNIGFGIFVLLVWIVVCVLLSNKIFKKKDILV